MKNIYELKNETLYDVFHRDWWTATKNGGREPGAGPKTYIAHGVSWQTAREICEEYNSTHEPGFLSHKAEFEEA